MTPLLLLFAIDFPEPVTIEYRHQRGVVIVDYSRPGREPHWQKMVDAVTGAVAEGPVKNGEQDGVWRFQLEGREWSETYDWEEEKRLREEVEAIEREIVGELER